MRVRSRPEAGPRRPAAWAAAAGSPTGWPSWGNGISAPLCTGGCCGAAPGAGRQAELNRGRAVRSPPARRYSNRAAPARTGGSEPAWVRRGSSYRLCCNRDLDSPPATRAAAKRQDRPRRRSPGTPPGALWPGLAQLASKRSGRLNWPRSRQSECATGGRYGALGTARKLRSPYNRP